MRAHVNDRWARFLWPSVLSVFNRARFHQNGEVLIQKKRKRGRRRIKTTIWLQLKGLGFENGDKTLYCSGLYQAYWTGRAPNDGPPFSFGARLVVLRICMFGARLVVRRITSIYLYSSIKSPLLRLNFKLGSFITFSISSYVLSFRPGTHFVALRCTMYSLYHVNILFVVRRPDYITKLQVDQTTLLNSKWHRINR